MTQLPIAKYAYLGLLAMTRETEINVERVNMNPIVKEGVESEAFEDMIGLQYIYRSMTDKGFKLQITMGGEELNLLPIGKGILEGIGITNYNEFRKNGLDVFDHHLDPCVKSQMTVMVNSFQADKYELRVIPWEQEILELQKNNEFAGIAGIFFPTLHFYKPDLKYTAVIRTEPILNFLMP